MKIANLFASKIQENLPSLQKTVREIRQEINRLNAAQNALGREMAALAEIPAGRDEIEPAMHAAIDAMAERTLQKFAESMKGVVHANSVRNQPRVMQDVLYSSLAGFTQPVNVEFALPLWLTPIFHDAVPYILDRLNIPVHEKTYIERQEQYRLLETQRIKIFGEIDILEGQLQAMGIALAPEPAP